MKISSRKFDEEIVSQTIETPHKLITHIYHNCTVFLEN